MFCVLSKLGVESMTFAVLSAINDSRAPGGTAARRASWVRKYGNPSMREILVKASGMARGRVRLRHMLPQMTFLHEVMFTQRDFACWLFEKSSQPAIQ